MKQFRHEFVELPTNIKRITSPSGKRLYEVTEGDGVFSYYPSVTTVLGATKNDSGLEEWRKSIGLCEANHVSRIAARRGSAVHTLIEGYLRNEPCKPMMPDAQNLFRRIIPKLDNIDNIRLLEGQLYSSELELAGTLDCVADYYGAPSFIDFKTSSSPRELYSPTVQDYFLQLTAYGVMYNARYGTDYQSLIILMTNPVSEPQVFMKRLSEEMINSLLTRIHTYKERSSDAL
jgi:hypothetical protein